MMDRLLPKTVDTRYEGNRLAGWVFLLLAIVSLGRSLVHLLAPDGGAGSIAGIDLSNGGKDSIVFAFGLWGLSQVIYACLLLLVALRYRTLIPLMYLVLILEIVGRMAVGFFKPPELLHAAPGGIANYILLPLSVLLFLLSLWKGKGSGSVARS